MRNSAASRKQEFGNKSQHDGSLNGNQEGEEKKGDSEMTDNVRNKITKLLLSKSRHTKYFGTFVVLAMSVAICVALALHLDGIAMSHKEKVLACPVTGRVAHSHDGSCYDADGRLVCPLPELELHVHTDECYETTTEAVCGMDESDGHEHTDGCYAETRVLVCGMEEITEEHAHGPRRGRGPRDWWSHCHDYQMARRWLR